MIKLTRLNGQFMAVNPDFLKFIENTPDTVLTLITGEKVVVSESSDEVISRVMGYRRSIFVPCSSAQNLYCCSKLIGSESDTNAEEM